MGGIEECWGLVGEETCSISLREVVCMGRGGKGKKWNWGKKETGRVAEYD